VDFHGDCFDSEGETEGGGGVGPFLREEVERERLGSVAQEASR
jgi:hypothetical protein